MIIFSLKVDLEGDLIFEIPLKTLLSRFSGVTCYYFGVATQNDYVIRAVYTGENKTRLI